MSILSTRRKESCTVNQPQLLTSCRAKQYKEQFKLWGWQKYLPGGKAQWIVKKADKRKREDGKDTVFYYGGRMWPKERAEASAKRSKAQDTDSVAMGECLILLVCLSRMDV